MPISIRIATMDDLDAIVNIVDTVVPVLNSHGNYQWNETYPLRKDFAADIENHCLYVAIDEEGLVVGVAALTQDQPPEYGSCGMNIAEPAIVPHRVAVHPRCQGQGVAGAFMAHSDELARASGFKYVRVDTNELNLAMQRVFVRGGYVFKGETGLAGKPASMRFYCYEKSIE